ncbi:MAG: helicase C-terminal domain-containing protein [Planctomycetota bacterium]|nr:helicase C-terminal domain-containing protein [Planctomycetota bacterium]
MNLSRDTIAPEGLQTPVLPVLVTLWTTGSDPTLDGLVRIVARKMAPGDDSGHVLETPKGKASKTLTSEGPWLELDQFCDPFPDRPKQLGASSAAIHRRYGLDDAALRDQEPAHVRWAEFREFVGEAPLLVHDAELFRSWQNNLDRSLGEPAFANVVVGIEELERLGLGSAKTQSDESDDVAGWFERPNPRSIAERLGRLVEALNQHNRVFLALWAAGLQGAAHRFESSDPAAARSLYWALELLNEPEVVCRQGTELFEAGRAVDAGFIQRALDDSPGLENGLYELEPKGAEFGDDKDQPEPLPPTSEGLTPFPKEDRRLLKDVFEHHLPALMSESLGGEPSDYLRESQANVAQQVAQNLGRSGLLLVHAPTGTGKTLAYVVPALIWAVRNGLRVGVATYTRALQEQAMGGEVPRALKALARAGLSPAPRVTLLKGRENYLCWRSFQPMRPQKEDDGETWLAWTVLLTFAMTQTDGDLDRLHTSPPLALTSSKPYRQALTRTMRAARARRGCCTRSRDRATCLAELARKRAERSHLVITNQSFVLARREFLRHVIFDECEHLHDCAVSAFSSKFEFQDARQSLMRLHRPGRGTSRAALDRLKRQIPSGGASEEALKRALGRWQRLMRSIENMEEAAEDFDRRRGEDTSGQDDRSVHGYMRVQVAEGREAGLMQSRLELGAELALLETDLDRLQEVCDANKMRGSQSIRQGLELGRAELLELGKQLESWLPLMEGKPAFAKEIFYDVERTYRGELGLLSRVLLPSESLGRLYYPDLASGTFLSATTYLGGSFEASKNYLGLTRAEQPGDDEERGGRKVETFRVPEAFDYSRVLVGVARDAPPANGPRDEHRAFIARFIEQLCTRTGGRLLVLFTNLQDVRLVGEAVLPVLRRRGLPLYYQGMDGLAKEELSRLFRERTDSVLLGVDTFWFGADFPGDTLQYLAIARLPYGVPDRYHFAQCAALGEGAQRKQIYMPRALAKFRQGFGRLMRKSSDRGCVFFLDQRILDPRHRAFLRELPLAGMGAGRTNQQGAAMTRGPLDRVLRDSLAHMNLLSDMERRGMPLNDWVAQPRPVGEKARKLMQSGTPAGDLHAEMELIIERDSAQAETKERERFQPPIEVDPTDLPF